MRHMTLNLMPDAEHYSHPLFSWFVAFCLDFSVGHIYRIEHMIPRGHRLRAGTLVVSNHVRDSDIPILMRVLCRRQGWRFHEPLPYFAAREDLLRRDALASLAWPSPWSRPLGRIPVGWLFRSLRVRPMRRLREFTFGDTVTELVRAGVGAMHPVDLFNSRGQRELAAQLGPLPATLAAIDLRQLGRLRASIWGLRRLRLAALRRIEHAFRAHITRQLAGFAALLEEGHAVYVAPEGVISGSGRFGRIRAAPWQLLRRCSRPVPILPNTLNYDPLCCGRRRVIVHVGEPMSGLEGADPRDFANRLRLAILRLRVVTASHLTAWFLCVGPGQFTTSEFTDGLQQGLDLAASVGLTVDPLFVRGPLAPLAGERLRWLQRKRLVTRSGTHWLNTWPRDAPPGWNSAAGTVALLFNALADLSPQWQGAPRA
jgi:1-acyl-sn-glycerol-3-phosphate acyltransferase